GAAYALDTLGMAAHKLGRRAQAREQLDEGLRLLRALGDQMGVALLLTDLATVAVDGGEWVRARQQFWEAIAVSTQVGDRRRIAFCLEGLARALLPEQCDAAAQLLGAAEALREAIGAPLPPSEQAAYAASVVQVRAGCAGKFDANWARGRAAPLRELLATQGLALVPRSTPLPGRTSAPRVATADADAIATLLARDPGYGQIVCQCSQVSAGEVRAAMHGPVPARTLDALKRRLWTMAGPCQGSLCVAPLAQLLAEASGGSIAQVRKHVAGSEIIAG
ncbi:hypothetical protein SE17_35725, partial [Kouleothrix aurantiaca]